MECFWILSISEIKDFIVATAAIIGAVVAVLGLGAWKRQLKGQTEYELAKRILRLCYRYRDAISAVRHPFMSVNEMPLPEEDQAQTMSDAQRRFYGRAKGYEARWKRVTSTREELYPELLEAEVLWGQELTELIKPLSQLQVELLVAIEDELRVGNPDVPKSEKDFDTQQKQRERRNRILHASTTKDEFGSQFSGGIDKISQFLKDYLRR